MNLLLRLDPKSRTRHHFVVVVDFRYRLHHRHNSRFDAWRQVRPEGREKGQVGVRLAGTGGSCSAFCSAPARNLRFLRRYRGLFKSCSAHQISIGLIAINRTIANRLRKRGFRYVPSFGLRLVSVPWGRLLPASSRSANGLAAARKRCAARHPGRRPHAWSSSPGQRLIAGRWATGGTRRLGPGRSWRWSSRGRPPAPGRRRPARNRPPVGSQA